MKAGTRSSQLLLQGISQYMFFIFRYQSVDVAHTEKFSKIHCYSLLQT